MRASGLPALNLASDPFRADRKRLAMLVVGAVCLSCSLVVLLVLLCNDAREAAELQRSMAFDKSAMRRLTVDNERLSRYLTQPENEDVFAVNVFLNELIARRTVRWNRVFHDLGKVMPDNVQLISVRLPQIPDEDAKGVNHLQLDMVLGTDRPEAIVELLKKLQDSSLFGATQLLAQQPPSQNDPLHTFRIRVAYEQTF